VNVIVDASVAVKWFVNEVGSTQALELRAYHDVAAPDIVLNECRNAFLNKVRRQIISRHHAIQLEREFDLSDVTILSSTRFLTDAFRLALDVGGALYDCVYLASAMATDRVLVTADERFSTKARALGLAGGRVKLLSELAAAPEAPG